MLPGPLDSFEQNFFTEVLHEREIFKSGYVTSISLF